MPDQENPSQHPFDDRRDGYCHGGYHGYRYRPEGGIGIIHKNMSIEAQADLVDRVKRSENGVIVNPFFLSPSCTVREANAIMGRYKISGVPICEDGRLVGSSPTATCAL